ncbi:hypothetical protein ACJA28_00125 [Mesomycoplasma moatsii]|uniref:hypothetical protein n=1 Tax=Mesomycoplasma moatsii TaxID=171287 RepID=UPI0003B62E8C
MKDSNKINVDIKRINNKTKQIEWTETLEIPYEAQRQISEEEKRKIEEIYSKKEGNFVDDRKSNPLLNTLVLNMELNPFHQQSMNTLEFKREDTTTIVNISKKDNSETIGYKEEIEALKKLLENKIITEKEFEEKKELISNRS